MVDEQFQRRVHGMIRRFRAELSAVASNIPDWIAEWNAKHRGTKLEGKWDHYAPEFLRGPLWDELQDRSAEEQLQILWDWCSTHLSCLPGPVVMLHLRWTIKIVLAFPTQFGRGFYSGDSPVIRFYGLLNEHACPDGIAAKDWDDFVGRSLITLSGQRVLRQEFRCVREMMCTSVQHLLREGFLKAIARGERLMMRAMSEVQPRLLRAVRRKATVQEPVLGSVAA